MIELETLGQRIRRLRTERRMPQDRLAIEAMVDQSGLSKFERGRERSMSEATLQRIAQALGVSWADLTAGTTYAPDPDPTIDGIKRV